MKKLINLVSIRSIIKPKKYSYYKDFINPSDFITYKNMKILILTEIYFRAFINIILKKTLKFLGYLIQQFLYFFPLPQGHGEFRPILLDLI